MLETGRPERVRSRTPEGELENHENRGFPRLRTRAARIRA